MTIKEMHLKLCKYLGMSWMDEYFRLQNEEGYSPDGAIVKCYNSYFTKQ